VSGIYPDGTTYGSYPEQGTGDAGLMDIDGSHHNVFRGNTVHDFSNVDGRGIWTQGYTHDDLFEGNVVTEIRPTSGIGQSIDLDGAATVEWNHTVRGNRVVGNNYVGIQLENVFASVVENNVVLDTGSSGITLINYDDRVGCPAVGEEGNPYGDTDGDGNCKDEVTNNVVRQNLIVTSGGWDWGYGGIMNWGACSVSILANTIYSSHGSGNGAINYQDGAAFSDGAVVRGNIFASADGIAICSLDGFEIFAEDDHNLLSNGRSDSVYGSGAGCGDGTSLADYQTATGRGVGSADGEPAWVAAGTDFHLTTASPALDASVDLGLTADIEGSPRPRGAGYDMGAYEYPSP
jgi:hypothetical protein